MTTKAVRRLSIGGLVLLMAAIALMLLLAGGGASAANFDFADQRFQNQWNKYDAAIKNGTDKTHSWVYGPDPHESNLEAYAQAQNGQRLVQYFDKARMEITNNPQFPVTSGLLTVELVSGQQQNGDSSFVSRPAANVPVAGDSNDPNGPTYADFVREATYGSPQQHRKDGGNTLAITEGFGHTGIIPLFSPRPVTATNKVFFNETGHNIPDIFIDWLSAYEAQRGSRWLDVVGLPVTEAYWANVQVGGVQKVVLMQLFERRALTFTSTNNDPYKVEFGNIGLAYQAWRYAGQQPTPGTTTAPATTAPGSTPTATPTVTTAPATPAPTSTPPSSGSYSIQDEYIFAVDGAYSVTGFIRNNTGQPLNLDSLNVTAYDSANSVLNGDGDSLSDIGRIPAGGRIPFRIELNVEARPARLAYNVQTSALSADDAAGLTTAFATTNAQITVMDDGSNFGGKDYVYSISVKNNSGADVTAEAFVAVYDSSNHLIDAFLSSALQFIGNNGTESDEGENIPDTLPAAPSRLEVFTTGIKQ